MITTDRHRATLPTLEQRLDALGARRVPRVQLLPGLRLPADLAPGELVPLVCPDCGRAGDWLFHVGRAVIICGCKVRWPSG